MIASAPLFATPHVPSGERIAHSATSRDSVTGEAAKTTAKADGPFK